MSYPNQNFVIVRREQRSKEHTYFHMFKDHTAWAATNLSEAAFKLYVYLISNQDDYRLELSPAAFERAYGVGKHGYYNALKTLKEKGVLTLKDGTTSTWEFHEMPISPKGNAPENDKKSSDFPEGEDMVPEGESAVPKRDNMVPEGVEKDNKITNITIDNIAVSSSEETAQVFDDFKRKWEEEKKREKQVIQAVLREKNGFSWEGDDELLKGISQEKKRKILRDNRPFDLS